MASQQELTERRLRADQLRAELSMLQTEQISADQQADLDRQAEALDGEIARLEREVAARRVALGKEGSVAEALEAMSIAARIQSEKNNPDVPATPDQAGVEGEPAPSVQHPEAGDNVTPEVAEGNGTAPKGAAGEAQGDKADGGSK